MSDAAVSDTGVARVTETLTFAEGDERAPPSATQAHGVGEGGAAPKSPPAVNASTVVAGRYVAIRELGKGAFGTVFAAHDSELHRQVALKFIRTGLEGDRANEWRARLMREAKAMARVSHPNVVTLYDVGVSNEGGVFLAMELIEGGTLGDWLRGGPRTWKQIVSHVCAAGDGLAAAHRAGIIHRDFKLENVLLGADGRPRVTDFGIARSAETTTSEASESMPGGLSSPLPTTELSSRRDPESLIKLTATGAMMGTPGYMAPEQYLNDVEIDARADVFAFCATLYRALYGERPFAGETLEQIAFATLGGDVRKPPKRAAAPAWVHKVVLAGLSRDRNARPGSIDEVLIALRNDRFRAPRGWGFAAVGLVAIVSLLGLSARELAARAEKERGIASLSADRAHPLGGESPRGEAEAVRPAALADKTAPIANESPAVTAEHAAAPSGLPARRIAPPPATQTAPSLRPKTRTSSPTSPVGRPTHAGPGTCTVEANYDAEGAPHFKRVCN